MDTGAVIEHYCWVMRFRFFMIKFLAVSELRASGVKVMKFSDHVWVRGVWKVY